MLADGESVHADLPIAARWEMNEGSRASTMRDAGPHGLDGDIGSAVGTGGGDFFWSNVSPTMPPAKPERLVLVDHDWRLQPGTADFDVEFRYRSHRPFGNILQKGQNGAVGGYWKFEQPNGRVTCLVKDATGKQRAVKARTATNDHRWHTIRCTLREDAIRIYVDGELDQINPLDSPMGRIGNDRPLSIGGKSNCDQIEITCDYFVGSVDWVEIRQADAVPPTTTTTSTTTSTTTTTTTTTTTVAQLPPPVLFPRSAEVATPARREGRRELPRFNGSSRPARRSQRKMDVR